MKILIITSFYPPDTAISAVRPYMLAKYLMKRGHQVTVLRSGTINKSADNFNPPINGVRVISFLGNDSPAERFERGEAVAKTASEGKSRIAFLPSAVRKVLSHTYHWIDAPRQYQRRKQRAAKHLELQKNIIDGLRDERFDIVFSTYSELENAYAGEYAKKVFSCKWIMDFRDPIAQGNAQPAWEYWLAKRIQDRIIRRADACTAVSDSLLKDKKTNKRDPKIITLYNGYEEAVFENKNEAAQPGILSFCYTGQIYRMRTAAAAAALAKAIAALKRDGTIDTNRIRFQFAGSGVDELKAIMRQYGVEEILEDHGYLTKSEIIRLQSRCDIFTVLSWNTQTEQGVLTGKFYEGIRARKPILSLIAGEVPESELFLLNQKYNYGFCYEVSRKQQFTALCDYIKNAYHQKLTTGSVDYSPNESLFTDFRYDQITEKLIALSEQLVKKDTE